MKALATEVVNSIEENGTGFKPLYDRNDLMEDKIKTIEGNTNKKDEKGVKDSESGDGVWEKERVPSLAKSYIRIFS